MSLTDRIRTHVSVDQDGCWIWTGARDPSTGYGRCNKTTYGSQWAHRASYMAHVGPIPEGLTLDHLCRVRECVNPEHLEPVTNAENTRRSPIMGRVYKARSAATHCVNGHERTTENTYVAPRSGHSACRICKSERQQKRRAA